MTLVATLKKMLASEPRELGDRRRKMREAMERAQDGMSVLGHHQGETTIATTKTTIVLVGGREMDTSTASPMEALSTDDSMEKRKNESKIWMLETRSEGGIMKSRCYSKRVTFTSSPNLDGWSGEAYEAGRIGPVFAGSKDPGIS